ncbi:hypothetical protein FRB94_002605 [Tulasnella sp. JGI-2019a]|nr:hypothetical protein FRB93_012945 [Tulasnella sp. JGI-2019a]KAG8986683.1 hypothetical protein FRB94_002605 [Tulasnella sp. JGI-2019a]KAG9021413.1 hypothetical protein FRB95_002162 [Tulasnella sp. JGI-2019a]
MIQWLSHQEAVAIHVAYINWLYSENMGEEDSQDDEAVIEAPGIGTSIETEGKGGGGEANLDMDLDDESDISDDSEEADTGAIIIEHSIYDFAKTSPLPRLTVDILSDHFGATHLLPAVHSYFKSFGHVLRVSSLLDSDRHYCAKGANQGYLLMALDCFVRVDKRE